MGVGVADDIRAQSLREGACSDRTLFAISL